MKIQFTPYFLEFFYPFGLSVGSRTHTPVVFIRIEAEGFYGYGEAALPPYLPESQDSVIQFFKKLNFSLYTLPLNLPEIHSYIDSFPGNYSAKAAIDMALYDIQGKYLGLPAIELLGIKEENFPLCTFTLGISDAISMQKKIEDAKDFKIFKIKLGGERDKEIIENFKKFSEKPFCVDANQGWSKKENALEMSYWLKEKGAILLEQPLPKENYEDYLWLNSRSPLPLFADESVQTLEDLEKAKKCFGGINVKLMKCGGLLKAKELIEKAKLFNMSILVGCMSESSCGVSAAAVLSSSGSLADLDGPYLIKNDPFIGMTIKEGKISLNNKPGLGIAERKDFNLIFND